MPAIPNGVLNSIGLAVLRLAVGGMMLTHGWPKIDKLFTTPIKFADPIGLGPDISLWLTVFAEVGCAALIVAGAATRLAAIPLFITMVVAAFVVHGDDPFSKQELALLYGAGTLTLLLAGPGQYSVDAWFQRRRSVRR